MKSSNKKSVVTDISVQPVAQTEQQIIRVNFLDSKNHLLQAYDHDAMSMSQKFPNEKCITVYHNGIPETMSVTELVKDALLHIKADIED